MVDFLLANGLFLCFGSFIFLRKKVISYYGMIDHDKEFLYVATRYDEPDESSFSSGDEGFGKGLQWK
jgi:hypothetical protein